MPTGDPVIALPTCMNIACIDFHSTPLHLSIPEYPRLTPVHCCYQCFLRITDLDYVPLQSAHFEQRLSLNYIITHLEFFFLLQPFAYFATTITTTTQNHSYGRLQHTQSSPLSFIPTLPSSPHTQQRNESPRQSHSRRPDCHTQDQQNVTTIEGSVRPYKLDPFEC